MALLPAEHDRPACAAFTRELGARPAGSGLALERIVVVSVSTPWPKPALNHELLKPLTGLVTASAVSTRLFAGEPAPGAATIEVYDRSGLGATVSRFDPDDATVAQGGTADWLVDTITLIAACGPADMGTLVGQAAHGTHRELDAPALLICTQGSHDNCCGVHGEALAARVATANPQVHVRRVSHTGGHRFAPTAMALPQGRMWAFLDDPALLDRVLDDVPTASDLAAHCRGWWGAATGPSQVAELAARTTHGRPFAVEPSIEAVGDAAAGNNELPVTYVVAAGTRSWQVQVEHSRTIPSIACGAPGGLPAKQGREYSWTITEVTT